MIETNTAEFPVCIVRALESRMKLIDPEVPVYMRPLKPNDGIQAIGIYPTTTSPDVNSQEIKGPATMGGQIPTLLDHYVHIQVMVMHSDAIEGIAQHSTLSKRIRGRVATDASLRVLLSQLVATDAGLIESAQRWRLGRTEYQSGELRGQMLFMSVSEFWLQTEIK